MPVFTFSGKSENGEKVSGERVAPNKQALAAQLRKERINAGAIREKGKEFAMPTFGSGKVKTKEIAILRSMGYSRRDISRIFLWLGAIEPDFHHDQPIVDLLLAFEVKSVDAALEREGADHHVEPALAAEFVVDFHRLFPAGVDGVLL